MPLLSAEWNVLMVFSLYALFFPFRSHCLCLVYENSIVSWFEFVGDFRHGSYLNSNFFLFLVVVARLLHTKLRSIRSCYWTLSHTSLPHTLPLSLCIFLYHFIQIIIILGTLHSHCACFIAMHLRCFLYVCVVYASRKSMTEEILWKTKYNDELKYEKKLTTTHALQNFNVLWQFHEFCMEIEWLKVWFVWPALVPFTSFCVCVVCLWERVCVGAKHQTTYHKNMMHRCCSILVLKIV